MTTSGRSRWTQKIGRQLLDAYDVVVLGGGMAGLLFARQLRMRAAALSILVLERETRPLPLAAHKMGESSVEGATYWMQHTLGLKGYLDEQHLPKLGLRFFGGAGGKEVAERFELGAIDFPPIPSVQLERGSFENDLRAMASAEGIHLLDNAVVKDVELAEPLHRVQYVLAGEATDAVTARWVVDASGWRRLLSSKLGLSRPSEHHASACWFRVAGAVEPCRTVPASSAVHDRCKADRWYSTNHLMGDGYWVWLIPLSSHHTSIGVVTQEALHPIVERNTFAKTMSWLQRHEPALHRMLERAEPLDFLVKKNFSHQTSQAFSKQRWACIGPAAAFTDPLYSMGADIIAWTSSSAVSLIEADQQGALSDELVALHNDSFSAWIDDLTRWFCQQYRVFRNDRVTLLKILWDGIIYFSFHARALIQEVLADSDRLRAYNRLAAELYALNTQVQQLFIDWAEQVDAETVPAGFYNPGMACPALRPATLGPPMVERKSQSQLVDEGRACLAILRQVACTMADMAREQGVAVAAWPETAGEFGLDQEALGQQLSQQLRAYVTSPVRP